MRSIQVISFTVILGLTGCSEPVVEQQANISSRPAKLFEVRRDSSVEEVSLPATIEASDQTFIAFQVPGRLAQLNVEEGDEVLMGQVIATLDQREFRNAVTSQQAGFTRAQNDYQRASELYEQDAIARSIVDARFAEFEATRAGLDSAKKHLEDSTLNAPFNGVVAEINVEEYELVGPHQPILTLQSSDSVEAVVQVPASIVIVSEQANAEEVYLELDAAPGVYIPAYLGESAAVADPGTQTFAVKFRFSPPDDLLVLPGMTGTLRGHLSVRDQSNKGNILVPISAVVSNGEGTFTWVVDTESMSVSRRDIEVEIGTGNSVLVTNGLDAGETIVSAGGSYLFDGALVRHYEP